MENITIWWNELSPQWQQAFRETVLHHANEPSVEELENIVTLEVLRCVGPSAPYPNMSFELTDLSGLSELTHLKILVVTHHAIENIEALKSLSDIKSLFLNSNKLMSIVGVENMTQLEQLYIQYNQLQDLNSLHHLKKLQDVYVHDNDITELDWLTDDHADSMKTFYCMPNKNLKDRDILKIERNIGIRCRTI